MDVVSLLSMFRGTQHWQHLSMVSFCSHWSSPPWYSVNVDSSLTPYLPTSHRQWLFCLSLLHVIDLHGLYMVTCHYFTADCFLCVCPFTLSSLPLPALSINIRLKLILSPGSAFCFTIVQVVTKIC